MPKKDKNNQTEFYEKKLNAKVVWGVLINKLRSLKMITLYTACGEIRDVEFDKNVLKVFVKDEYLFNILNKEESVNKIEEILKQNYDKISVKFQKSFESYKAAAFFKESSHKASKKSE